jgi:hypothetical protein
MRSLAVVLALLTIAPALSAAQSPITRPREQAQRAVANANAHTRAMTDTTAGAAARPATTSIAATRTSAPSSDTLKAAEDTTRARVTTSTGSTEPERATFEREVFSYQRGGRRDPFISLMTSSDIRPMIADLRLVAIAYDPSGRNSVAVLREDAQEQRAATAAAGNKATADVPQYRVKEGQQIGRMRVARISTRSVTFTIEEFGYSRQETLALSDSNTEKKP